LGQEITGSGRSLNQYFVLTTPTTSILASIAEEDEEEESTEVEEEEPEEEEEDEEEEEEDSSEEEMESSFRLLCIVVDLSVLLLDTDLVGRQTRNGLSSVLISPNNL
jgi:hypothetical protein